MPSKQIAWGRAGDDVVVLLHADKNAPDEDWDAYLAFVKTVRVAPDRLRTLVFSDGGRPTFEQRRRLSDLVRGRPSRVAIVTDAASIHFISAQLSLEGPSSRTFSCADFPDAVVHLALTAFHLADVKACVARLLGDIARCDSAKSVLGL